MNKCNLCSGFVPGQLAVCPHCGADQKQLPGWAKGLMMVAGAGAASITLAACYGAPAICNYPDGGSGDCYSSTGTTGGTSGGTSGSSDAGGDGGH